MLAGDAADLDIPHQMATPVEVFPPLQRIVINDDVGPAGSRAFAAPFDAVVSLSVGCSGTLIAPNVVLSARHCQGLAGDQVRFGDNSNSPIFTSTVASVVTPAGNGSLLDGGDVQILILSANVPANVATPTRLIDATDSLEGSVAATIGYGFNGVGSVGHQNGADGFRWGGENIIDVFGSPAGSTGSNIFSTDFDDGTAGSNTIPGSDPTPLAIEATTAPGDSGGPLLVQVGSEWVIAGVLSGGTTSTSVFGDISWWTGTAAFRAEIESVGGVFVGEEAGTVRFDAASYPETGTINVSVSDSNATGPITVTIDDSSGESETLTLTDDGTGSGTFTGSINSVTGSDVPGDGVLQVVDGDALTVTYLDNDDGMGGTLTATATANILVPQSTVAFDASVYSSGGTITVTVDEPNSSANSLTVTVGASSGDSEAITLTANGDGTFSASINSATGSPNGGDGILQVVDGDTLTVTYADPDNGLGGTSLATDTASVSIDDHANSANGATSLAVPFNATGALEEASDVDFFSFNAVAGVEYRFETTLGTLFDSTLTLFDTNGTTQLSFNDDGGVGLASLISWTAPANGTYFISVAPFFFTQTGTYQLNATASVIPGTIVGRHVFYDGSSFDGDAGVHSANDDAALDSSKSALTTGTATFSNYTNFEGGITGLFIDIAGLPGTPTLNDFEFQVGNTNTATSWTELGTAPTISVRAGAGDGGSDRVSLIWAAGTIVDQWLEVTVLANGPTNLVASDDVHYWGNQRGETGNSPTNTIVSSADVGNIITQFSGFSTVGPDSDVDLNKDGRVDSGDVSAAIARFSGFTSTLQIISRSAAPVTLADASLQLPVASADEVAEVDPTIERLSRRLDHVRSIIDRLESRDQLNQRQANWLERLRVSEHSISGAIEDRIQENAEQNNPFAPPLVDAVFASFSR